VPAIFDRVLTEVDWPHDQMRCADADLVITSGAPICLGGPRCGDRPDFV